MGSKLPAVKSRTLRLCLFNDFIVRPAQNLVQQKECARQGDGGQSCAATLSARAAGT